MKKFITLTFLIFYFSQFLSSYVENEDSAPEFKLSDSYGNEISLSSFIGKKVVLEWTNHGCPYVAKHYETGNMQSTQEFAKEEEIIWLSIISSAPGTQGYVSSDEANTLTITRKASPSHVLFDPTGEVGRIYDAKTTPHMYIINEEGLMKYQGAIDDAGGRGFMSRDLLKAKNYVKESLQQMGTGEEISSPVTKPYGCSVKYAS
jgi:thioredoxin-related protein